MSTSHTLLVAIMTTLAGTSFGVGGGSGVRWRGGRVWGFTARSESRPLTPCPAPCVQRPALEESEGVEKTVETVPNQVAGITTTHEEQGGAIVDTVADAGTAFAIDTAVVPGVTNTGAAEEPAAGGNEPALVDPALAKVSAGQGIGDSGGSDQPHLPFPRRTRIAHHANAPT